MAAQLTTLTPADLQRFERDGYVVIRQAFSRADGLAMERRWWRELEDTRGIRRDDRSSWRQIPGDLKAAKRDPIQARILTERVRGAFDDLLGPAAWPAPRDWGRAIVTFPGPGAWDVPARAPCPGTGSTALTRGSWRSPGWRRHPRTGSPRSWTPRPPWRACRCAWSS